jgi:hypothetical protein
MIVSFLLKIILFGSWWVHDPIACSSSSSSPTGPFLLNAFTSPLFLFYFPVEFTFYPLFLVVLPTTHLIHYSCL